MTARSRILIVDDEPFNLDYLEQELEDLGYLTTSARDGQEALAAVAAEPPDLILLDVMMPGMDGLTACRLLKANEDTRLIPIVIMTALDAVEDRIKGIEAGADDYLTKPVNERELAARIQTSLRVKHTVDRRLRELRRIRDHFEKFVPQAVRRLVSANPDAPALAKREREVTILFLDISGYGELSERLPPAALNALVERYFSTFLDRIHEAGGDINETAGDGFMAIFQDSDPPGHARRAVDAALGLLDAASTLNREGAGSLAIHMGINTGIALVGATRFEGMRGTRWTFTASGAVTNLAARLAGVAGPGQIVVGAETARRLGGHQVERMPAERLKNTQQTTEIYRVVPPVGRPPWRGDALGDRPTR
jgi:DNA-binding response OmpR family regulator